MGWYSAAVHEGAVRYGRNACWVMDPFAARSSHVPARWKGDGIISLIGRNASLNAFVARAGVPVVNIGYVPRPVGPALPGVVHDNGRIGLMAAEHFLGRGFRHFAAYTAQPNSGERERIAAFAAGVRPGASSFHVLDWQAVRRKQRGRYPDSTTWLADQLPRLPKPLAVMGVYDDPAIEVIDACGAAGLRVPEQVAVLGVDNDKLRCDLAAVPLSSIDNDMEGLGYEAAALLDRLMRGEAAPAAPLVVAPKGVVTRQSTEILAIPHPEVASALRVIWDRFTEPLTAPQVAAAVSMSTRYLHDAFTKHVGHSIAAEITRRRLQLARTLLAETNQKTYEIARRCGLGTAAHLAHVFSRHEGQTPSQYRKRTRTHRTG